MQTAIPCTVIGFVAAVPAVPVPVTKIGLPTARTALPCSKFVKPPFVALNTAPPCVGTTPLPLASVGVAFRATPTMELEPSIETES